jgi:hypothetical protein
VHATVVVTHVPLYINKIPESFLLEQGLDIYFPNTIVKCSFEFVVFRKFERMFFNPCE